MRRIAVGWLVPTLIACGSPGGASESSATASTGSTAASESSSATGSSSSGGSTTSAESTDDGDDPSEQAWQDFVDQREDFLLALSEPIVDCVGQQDTQHPAFHGCIDWHSAVHATYSLLAISRLTGEPEFADLADETLDATAIAAELMEVEGGALPQEIPYGYAWFLTLAVERARGGDDDLVPLATEIAFALRAWLDGRSDAQIGTGILADDYANVSWAVLNLWQWGQWTGDEELSGAMEAFTRDRIMTPALDQACPLAQEETDIDDFFPPCLHRLMTIVTVLPPQEHLPWLEQYLYANWELAPLTDIGSAHQGGLNFSRAWGLWAAWRASENTVYRDLYIAHVVTHVMQPQYWAEDYYSYSHWVAQFGVHAIALSY